MPSMCRPVVTLMSLVRPPSQYNGSADMRWEFNAAQRFSMVAQNAVNAMLQSRIRTRYQQRMWVHWRVKIRRM